MRQMMWWGADVADNMARTDDVADATDALPWC
jgi:hypothetical protein